MIQGHLHLRGLPVHLLRFAADHELVALFIQVIVIRELVQRGPVLILLAAVPLGEAEQIGLPPLQFVGIIHVSAGILIPLSLFRIGGVGGIIHIDHVKERRSDRIPFRLVDGDRHGSHLVRPVAFRLLFVGHGRLGDVLVDARIVSLISVLRSAVGHPVVIGENIIGDRCHRRRTEIRLQTVAAHRVRLQRGVSRAAGLRDRQEAAARIARIADLRRLHRFIPVVTVLVIVDGRCIVPGDRHLQLVAAVRNLVVITAHIAGRQQRETVGHLVSIVVSARHFHAHIGIGGYIPDLRCAERAQIRGRRRVLCFLQVIYHRIAVLLAQPDIAVADRAAAGGDKPSFLIQVHILHDAAAYGIAGVVQPRHRDLQSPQRGHLLRVPLVLPLILEGYAHGKFFVIGGRVRIVRILGVRVYRLSGQVLYGEAQLLLHRASRFHGILGAAVELRHGKGVPYIFIRAAGVAVFHISIDREGIRAVLLQPPQIHRQIQFVIVGVVFCAVQFRALILLHTLIDGFPVVVRHGVDVIAAGAHIHTDAGGVARLSQIQAKACFGRIQHQIAEKIAGPDALITLVAGIVRQGSFHKADRRLPGAGLERVLIAVGHDQRIRLLIVMVIDRTFHVIPVVVFDHIFVHIQLHRGTGRGIQLLHQCFFSGSVFTHRIDLIVIVLDRRIRILDVVDRDHVASLGGLIDLKTAVGGRLLQRLSFQHLVGPVHRAHGHAVRLCGIVIRHFPSAVGDIVSARTGEQLHGERDIGLQALKDRIAFLVQKRKHLRGAASQIEGIAPEPVLPRRPGLVRIGKRHAEHPGLDRGIILPVQIDRDRVLRYRAQLHLHAVVGGIESPAGEYLFALRAVLAHFISGIDQYRIAGIRLQVPHMDIYRLDGRGRRQIGLPRLHQASRHLLVGVGLDHLQPRGARHQRVRLHRVEGDVHLGAVVLQAADQDLRQRAVDLGGSGRSGSRAASGRSALALLAALAAASGHAVRSALPFFARVAVFTGLSLFSVLTGFAFFSGFPGFAFLSVLAVFTVLAVDGFEFKFRRTPVLRGSGRDRHAASGHQVCQDAGQVCLHSPASAGDVARRQVDHHAVVQRDRRAGGHSLPDLLFIADLYHAVVYVLCLQIARDLLGASVGKRQDQGIRVDQKFHIVDHPEQIAELQVRPVIVDGISVRLFGQDHLLIHKIGVHDPGSHLLHIHQDTCGK